VAAGAQMWSTRINHSHTSHGTRHNVCSSRKVYEMTNNYLGHSSSTIIACGAVKVSHVLPSAAAAAGSCGFDSFTFVSNEKRNKVVSEAHYMHTQLSLMLFCLCVGCVSETFETFASGTSNTSSSKFSVGLALLPASFGLHMRAYACMSSWVPECACRDNKEIKNTTLRTFIQ
jgi:hypothetical protein